MSYYLTLQQFSKGKRFDSIPLRIEDTEVLHASFKQVISFKMFEEYRVRGFFSQLWHGPKFLSL